MEGVDIFVRSYSLAYGALADVRREGELKQNAIHLRGGVGGRRRRSGRGGGGGGGEEGGGKYK